MKVGVILDLLSQHNRDDELLLPCSEKELTDKIRVQRASMDYDMGGDRHVLLLPGEGDWNQSDWKLKAKE